jgi:putative transposase
MGAPFTQLYVHLVWSTHQRLPLLTTELEGPLYSALSAKCTELKCRLMAIGNVEEHIHLLVQVHPAVSVAQLVKHLKGSSSHLVTHVLAPGLGFGWQEAYGAFTVSHSAMSMAAEYCQHQKEHHCQGTLYAQAEQCGEEYERAPADNAAQP